MQLASQQLTNYNYTASYSYIYRLHAPLTIMIILGMLPSITFPMYELVVPLYLLNDTSGIFSITLLLRAPMEYRQLTTKRLHIIGPGRVVRQLAIEIGFHMASYSQYAPFICRVFRNHICRSHTELSSLYLCHSSQLATGFIRCSTDFCMHMHAATYSQLASQLATANW